MDLEGLAPATLTRKPFHSLSVETVFPYHASETSGRGNTQRFISEKSMSTSLQAATRFAAWQLAQLEIGGPQWPDYSARSACTGFTDAARYAGI